MFATDAQHNSRSSVPRLNFGFVVEVYPTSGIKSRGYCGHRSSSASSRYRVGFKVRE